MSPILIPQALAERKEATYLMMFWAHNQTFMVEHDP